LNPEPLNLLKRPQLHDTRLIIGFDGWMDGGDVSTGSIDWLIRKLDAEPLAEIIGTEFHLYSFPGDMEVSAMFRPAVKIEEGLIVKFEPPVSTFHHDAENRLILFRGREPHVNWPRFADCIFTIIKQFDARMIYFVGSVAGAVPHTRDPRFFSSVSHPELKEEMKQFGCRFSNYEGPGSFVTYLTIEAARRDVPLATLVAEIPPYVQGTNPRCIEATLRKLAAILNLPLGLDDLRAMSNAFEKRVDESIEEHEELCEMIAKLEADYDSDVFNQMGDFKSWLQQRGIQLD
jgi:proteasome assembly chaperone (PAC2) family protein